MYFSVIVINTSFITVERDYQSYCHDVFEIHAPDGSLVPYAVGIRQSCGEPYELKPFHGVYARRNMDILEDYAIRAEGEYKIRVKKLGDDLPSSNTVRFTVKGGSPPVVDGILRSIRGALPKGWRAGRCSYEFENRPPLGRINAKTIVIQITRRVTYKNRIEIYFTEKQAPEDKQRDPKMELSRYLGKNSLGHFYFCVMEETDQTWPTYEKDLKKALSIK
jgi:hypothetical protein